MQMAWLSSWLREIVAIILLAAIVDLLLPNQAMQRYARLIIGLLILLALLSPILNLVQGGITGEMLQKIQRWDVELSGGKPPDMPSLNEINQQAESLKRKQQQQALALMEARVATAMLEQLEKRTGWTISQVHVELSKSGSSAGQEITHVAVMIGPGPGRGEQARQDSGTEKIEEIAVEAIAPIAVETSIEAPGAEAEEEAHAPRESLADNEDRVKVDARLVAQIQAVLLEGWGVPQSAVTIRQLAGNEGKR